MLQAVDVEFPPEIVAACVAAYVRTPPQHPAFSKHRRNGRSFPTDYRLPDDEESIAEVIARTTRELDVHRGPGPLVWSQTRQSVAADKRVFAGPSPSDVAALPHIGEAWCVAEFICAELGLRADTWTVQGLRRAHLRYGLLLDWATRDVARRLARDRDGISMPEGFALYGCDAIRIALEHGAVPDELDLLVSNAGLFARGSLCPWLEPRKPMSPPIPQDDPNLRAIQALKESYLISD